VQLTAANVHDSQVAIDLVGSVEPIYTLRGRPRHRPDALAADKAYDSQEIRQQLRWLGIRPLIPRRGAGKERGVGPIRWVVERTHAWFNQFRRLRVRYEKLPEIHEAFLLIGSALICWNFIKPWF